MDGIQQRFGSYLPHWTAEQATYAVTFRQADSLPADVRDSLGRLRAEYEELTLRPHSMATAIRASRVFNAKADEFLNSGYGSCRMKNRVVADLVQDALCHFDGVRYQLWAWVVMPNHVHAVLTPIGEWSLPRIMHSWKSFTSHAINRLEGTSGTIWQTEYFDHLIRGPEDFRHCVQYVLNNPAEAGLRGWQWVSGRQQVPQHIQGRRRGGLDVPSKSDEGVPPS